MKRESSERQLEKAILELLADLGASLTSLADVARRIEPKSWPPAPEGAVGGGAPRQARQGRRLSTRAPGRRARDPRRSAKELWSRFRSYGRQGDFVGMDMARKYLQMGWTRARRYANHPSGRKYEPGTRNPLPAVEDPTKAESARVFFAAYQRALKDPRYRALELKWNEANARGQKSDPAT